MNRLCSFALLACMGVSASAAEPPTLDAARYDRAARFMTDQIAPLVLNVRIAPHWYAGSREHFTWRRETGEGRAVFERVDAATGKSTAAFDASLIAAGLQAASGKPIDPQQLPFFDFDETATGIRFSDGSKTWDCSTTEPRCRDAGIAPLTAMEVASPNGQWIAYLDNGNLWVRSPDGATRFALTHDAEPRNSYAADPEMSWAINAGTPFKTPPGEGTSRIGPPTQKSPPALLWSPDSRFILTDRLDERQVRERSITQSTPTDGTLAPITWTWKSAQANDPILPTAEHWIFDITARSGRKIDLPAQPVTFLSAESAAEAWWSPDSRQINLITRPRYSKSMTLNIIEAVSGKVRSPISETGKTFVEMAALGEEPMTRVLANGDVMWFSERSGFGHLYLYDKSGELKRPVTQGSWTVRNILHIDEPKGMVYVAANEHEQGDDPYWRKIYSVQLKDGKLRLLTPENADHFVWSQQQFAGSTRPSPQTRSPLDSFGFSPSGRYFIDSYGRFDQPTQHVLRSSAGGRIIAVIASTDVSRLTAIGWKPPERFSALAADNKTLLYGMLFKPTDFDPAKRYAVLDIIYPGPQSNRVRPWFNQAVQDNASSKAWAELGMIVMAVDGRGSALRSKSFHDNSYGELANAGNLDDHIAATRELSRRYPWIDIERVGMVGGSAGGYATAHALLTHPEFYRVGISDAGNHDQRNTYAVWGETYNGPEAGDNYTRAANPLLAAGLQGKLLLLQGDMDSNVLPAQTLQLAGALMKANKPFEMLIAPNYGHVTILTAGYPLRRAWDFAVTHLIGATPPADYQFPSAAAKER